MPKQEILPPLRSTQLTVTRSQNAVATVDVPGVNTGGYINSALTTWHSNYTARAVDALARLNVSETALTNAQTQLVESTIRQREALVRLQELPERLGHELAVRRVHRANEFREVQHVYEMNEMRRLKELTLSESELTHARATLTHARTVLTDAQQQLSAQQKHGEFNYELLHKKKNLELLDVELSAVERRMLLRHSLKELELPREREEGWERAEAAADGLDAVIEEEVDALFKRAESREK